MEQDIAAPNWFRIILPLLFLFALDITPQSVGVERALFRAGWSLEREQLANAANHLAEAARHLPWRCDLPEHAGISALAAGDPDLAINLFQLAERRGTLTDAGQLALGDAYLLVGEMEAAVQVWEKLGEVNPSFPQIYPRLLKAYQSQNNIDAAISTLKTWLAFEPENPEVLFQLGLHLYIKQPEESLQLLKQAAVVDPARGPKVRLLSETTAKASAENDPAYRLVIIGQSLGAIEAWDLALLAFTQAIQVNPEYAEAWALTGEARQQLGLDGLKELQHAQVLNPSSILVQTLHALYWQRQKNFEVALKYWELVSRREPQNPQWQIAIGELYRERGDLSAALDHYQQAVGLATEEPRHWRSLAAFSILNQIEVDQVGIPAAREVLHLVPEDATALDLLAQAFFAKGDHLSAERFLLRALESDPGYAPAHLHLGMVYLDQGKSEQGRRHLETAHDLNPMDGVGQQAQRLLKR